VSVGSGVDEVEADGLRPHDEIIEVVALVDELPGRRDRQRVRRPRESPGVAWPQEPGRACDRQVEEHGHRGGDRQPLGTGHA
jgi:hypothetical protein